MFENPKRGSQTKNFTTNVLKILDLKSSSEQIFSKNWCWVSLLNISIDYVIHNHYSEYFLNKFRNLRNSLRKQSIFGDITTFSPTKSPLRIDCRISKLMMWIPQIWVVLLIRWSKFPTLQGHSEAQPHFADWCAELIFTTEMY